MGEKDGKDIVLIVDDESKNIKILTAILNNNYDIKVAKNGFDAIILAEKYMPDLILLDILMPEMDGYETCSKIKDNPLIQDIPIIFVSAKDLEFDEIRGFDLGAADYIIKPISPIILTRRVKTQIALYNQNKELAKQVKIKTLELNSTREEIIKKLGKAAEYKDNETGFHIERMSLYSKFIALNYGLAEEQADLLLHAAPMHDVGKIGIPDRILQKRAKLTPEEFEIMKTHCIIGKTILGEHPSQLLKIASIVAYEHHEKWDGSGYPRSLKGSEINIFARIVTVADVFDALTSERPYKKAWPLKESIDYIKEYSGKFFDPRVVFAFEQALPEILKVYYLYNS